MRVVNMAGDAAIMRQRRAAARLAWYISDFVVWRGSVACGYAINYRAATKAAALT